MQSPPEPFKISPDEISEYSLDELVDNRLYLPAASRAQNTLSSLSSAEDYNYIFKLWHIRISCLVLAKLYSVAKEESRQLGDLGADKYRLKDGTCIAPWEFRLLLVRVQGGGDTQGGLTRYYSLAREARAEAAKTATGEKPDEDDSAIYVSSNVWKQRLRNLGLYVAAMLMGMNDFSTAIDHLTTLYNSSVSSHNSEDVEFSKQVIPTLALAYLHIGDTLSAREWFQKSGSDENMKAFTSAVCSMADADWPAADTLLQDELREKGDDSVKVVNNLAITKLHEGDLNEAITLLEELISNGSIHPTVLFNLFTLYDLLQEITVKSKTDLLSKIRENGTVSLGTYEFLRAGLV